MTQEMKALYYDGKLEFSEMPDPVPGEGEALIRVQLAGICRTDIEIVNGYMNFTGVPGHEFVGTVEDASEEEWTGKRVVGEINVAKGSCEMCGRDLERHCFDREVLGILDRDGAFAKKLCLPVKNLFVVPDDLPDEKAVFVEPVAACYEILEQTDLGNGKRVLVIGDGKLGALAAQVLKGAGCDVIVAGKYEKKMNIIKKNFGIRAVPAEEIEGEMFDAVIECSGRPSGLELATSALKPRGTLILKSTYNEKPQVDMSLWVVNEITVIGSRCGPFGPAIEALSKGIVDPLPLIDEEFQFDDAMKAFRAATKPGAGKILIKFG